MLTSGTVRWDRRTCLSSILPFVLYACLPSRSGPLSRETDDDAGGPPPIPADASDAVGDAPVAKPHALIGVDPPHGPFTGGTLVSLRGNGFASNARVWFGDTEV